MSAIASFTRFSISDLDALRSVATIQDDVEDQFHDFLSSHGREVADYGWSGYVLATVLAFLDERGIDLMKSGYEDLASQISEERESTCFVFTEKPKHAYLTKLSPDFFSEAEACSYCNEYNGSSDPEAGKAMLDGIRAIQQCMNQIDETSVVLLYVG